MVRNREKARQKFICKIAILWENMQIYLEVNILIAKEIISFKKFQVFIYVFKENIICL